MIERVYLKSLLGFESVTVEFAPGLIVISGPSGAGKSVFISAILSIFGIDTPEAKICEVAIDKPSSLISDSYELDRELIVRYLKKERVRYFINDQNISKRSLKALFEPFVNYLSVRDRGGFGSSDLIEMLDAILLSKDHDYKKGLKEYKKRYINYRNRQLELEEIHQREKKLTELIEFAKFEIKKIKSVDPKPGEDEELLKIKKQLSKIDKLNDALGRAEEIFAFEGSVSEVFDLAGKEGSYFFDAMNQLRADFEETQSLAQELEDTDVEVLLDRLEKISDLKTRYGSIEDALEYCKAKEEELAGYERSEESRIALEQFLQMESAELGVLASSLSKRRMSVSNDLVSKMQEYLHRLKLPKVSFEFESADLGELGIDRIELQVEGRGVDTLSGGEYNRLRLTLMVSALEMGHSHDEGVIILDEIDANVSGDESIAISEMISKLSQKYQIFAISHQPHLASKADQHILISKDDNGSYATVLDADDRVAEIARIIEGEFAGDEAIAFAKKLLASR